MSNASHLLVNVGGKLLKPVALPPGCGKLATKPLHTGSPTCTNATVDCRSIRHRPITMLEPDVLAFRPAELLKSFAQRGNPRRSFRVVLGIWHQDADPPHLVQRLRLRRKRPSGY